MFPVRVPWAFVWLVLVWSAPCVFGQVVVYNNSAEFSGYNANISNEYGDELTLAGSARVVTKLQFEYYGDFFSNLDERGKVRIYANDGPYWMGSRDYPTPGSLLWESPMFIVRPGGHTQEILVPSIKVPDRFTWTIQFYGVSMQTGVTTVDPNITNDVVGLLFYGSATVGQSFNDFWERLTGSFNPVQVSGPPKNNFATAVTAVTEAVIPRLTMERSGKYTKVRFPASLTNYVLQIRLPDGTWMNTAPAVKVGGNFERVFDPTLSFAMFRLKDISTPRGNVELSILVETNALRVRWPASQGGLVLQSSSLANLGVWSDRFTPSVPTGDYFESLLPRNGAGELFRLRQESVAARLEFANDGDLLRIRWPLTARGQKLQSRALASESWLDIIDAEITETPYYIEAAVSTEGEGRVFRLKP
jgi:hypothetical protein